MALGGSDVTVISSSSQIVGRITLDNRTSMAIYEAMLPFTIGRSNDCDLAIPDSHVSRRHCELNLVGGVLCLRDTSANGTFVGERCIADESITIDATTCINLGGTIRLKVTPENSSKDRRRTDRREGRDRRFGDDRREMDGEAASNVVKLERRGGERRDGDRRDMANDRRANDRRKIARG